MTPTLKLRFAGALCAFCFVAGPLVAPVHAAPVGRADAGSDVYAAECAVCHSVRSGENKYGPSLAAVVGRRAGTVTGYKYSDGLAHSGLVWTPDTLAAYIVAPKMVVPGDKMTYSGGDRLTAQNIADLIAFLKSTH